MRTSITKSVIAATLLFVCSQQLMAQQIIRERLIQKSKNQKTAAWILAGGGAVLLTIGVVVKPLVTNGGGVHPGTGPYSTTITNPAGKIILTASGALAISGSIPLFVASAKNKKKAMKISVTNQQAMIPLPAGWTYSLQPAIKLSVPLGRK